MRNLIRWQPASHLPTWNREMEHFFNEYVGRSLGQTSGETSACGSWSPAVNILEKADGIVITADLPGLKAEEVELTVDNGVLTLKGERTLEEVAEGETLHRVERCYGAFERSFTVPNSVDPSKIEARFVNGEMTVTLPKREETKPRSVKVKVATA